MALHSFLSRFGNKREKFKEMEDDAKMQRLLEQKGKNSNERELERFEEEERQKFMKQRLEKFRETRKAEMRGNVFANNKNLFQGHKSILTDDQSAIGGQSMFMGKGNMIGKSNIF